MHLGRMERRSQRVWSSGDWDTLLQRSVKTLVHSPLAALGMWVIVGRWV